MNILPVEIIQDIFGFVVKSKDGLGKLKLLFFVCKKFNNIINAKAYNFLRINKVETPDMSNDFKCWTSCMFSTCTFCMKPVKKDFYKEKYTVCYTCKQKIPAVSLTSAKKLYKLTEQDLVNNLPIEQVRNGYRRGTYITLFLERDVKRLADFIHGEKLKDLQAQTAERSEKLKMGKLKVIERREFLIDAILAKENTVSGYDINTFCVDHELFLKYVKTGTPKPEKRFTQLVEMLCEYIVQEKSKPVVSYSDVDDDDDYYYSSSSYNYSNNPPRVDSSARVTSVHILECLGCGQIASFRCENTSCKNCCKVCSFHVNLHRKLSLKNLF